jgi:membrane protein
MKAKDLFPLLKQTFKEWSEDKASRLAAALSYFTIFSLAPFLIIVIAVAGFFWGEQAVEGRIMDQIQGMVGAEGAQMIQTMLAGAYDPAQGIIATVISVVILLFAASGLFGQLQESLNVIWEVQPKPDRGIKGIIRDRFLSFTLILGVAFLLLVSLVLSAATSAFSETLAGMFPGAGLVFTLVNLIVTFGVVTLLFAMIFKVLPDAKVKWSDVWLGAAFTALLFAIGKELIGLYLGNVAVGSTYGAAGSLVVILLWIFYSAQILFFGAEFTQVYANRFGSRIVPAENAIPMTEKSRIQQGMPHRETFQAAARKEPGRAVAVEPHQGIKAKTKYFPDTTGRPKTPAERSMAALGGVFVAIIGFVGTTFIRSRRG